MLRVRNYDNSHSSCCGAVNVLFEYEHGALFRRRKFFKVEWNENNLEWITAFECDSYGNREPDGECSEADHIPPGFVVGVFVRSYAEDVLGIKWEEATIGSAHP